jgi:hypothetical protein
MYKELPYVETKNGGYDLVKAPRKSKQACPTCKHTLQVITPLAISPDSLLYCPTCKDTY